MTDVDAGRTGTLPLTGERTVPGVAEENYWFRRHEVVYRRAGPARAAATVLEVGCGEGYGADLLAGVARRVVALDYDAAAVGPRRAPLPARRRCPDQPGGAAGGRRGRRTRSISLQVIEHVWDHRRFLAECAPGAATRTVGWCCPPRTG